MDKFKMRPHSTPSQIYVVPRFHVVLAPIQCLHGHGIGHREKDQHSHEEMAGSTGVPQVGSLRANSQHAWQTPLDRRLNIATGRGLIKLSWPGLKSVPRKMSWEVKAIAYDLAYNPHSVDWSIQLWLLAPYAYIRIGLAEDVERGPYILLKHRVCRTWRCIAGRQLVLPLKPLTEEYKVGKTRLAMMKPWGILTQRRTRYRTFTFARAEWLSSNHNEPLTCVTRWRVICLSKIDTNLQYFKSIRAPE